MLPQPTNENSLPSLSPVCAQVRDDMNAVRDNRTTPAERIFVLSHVERCPGCASAWAFAQAAKAAWEKVPTAYPSASLSARIAAATYRKPTFAERFAAAFAFLNPAPVRVAIGVAAVAGVGFLVLPRLNAPVGESVTPVVVSVPKPSEETQTPVVSTPVKPSVATVAVKPVVPKTAPMVKKAEPKPVAVVAAKPVKPLKAVVSGVVAVSKLVAKPTPAKTVAKPVQIATAIRPVAPRRRASSPIESAPATTPEIKAHSPEIAAVTPPEVTVSVEPRIKEPAAVAPVPVAASLTVGERETSGGYIRISPSDAGRRISAAGLSGVAAQIARRQEFGIVNAPVGSQSNRGNE